MTNEDKIRDLVQAAVDDILAGDATQAERDLMAGFTALVGEASAPRVCGLRSSLNSIASSLEGMASDADRDACGAWNDALEARAAIERARVWRAVATTLRNRHRLMLEECSAAPAADTTAAIDGVQAEIVRQLRAFARSERGIQERAAAFSQTQIARSYGDRAAAIEAAVQVVHDVADERRRAAGEPNPARQLEAWEAVAPRFVLRRWRYRPEYHLEDEETGARASYDSRRLVRHVDGGSISEMGWLGLSNERRVEWLQGLVDTPEDDAEGKAESLSFGEITALFRRLGKIKTEEGTPPPFGMTKPRWVELRGDAEEEAR